MTTRNRPDSRHTRARSSIVCLLAFVVSGAVAVTQPVRADRINPPSVPVNLQVPRGNEVFLAGHAVGTQNYICLPSGSGFAWTLFGPQATLFDDGDTQIITHFLSPNPVEGGTPRATWQHSRDTSSVWALAIANSSDPAYVAQGAVPWLLLDVAGAQEGPRRGDRLIETTFIHRLNTTGGIAPSTGCAVSTDVGRRAFVPYTADYFFYTDRKGKDDDR